MKSSSSLRRVKLHAPQLLDSSGRDETWLTVEMLEQEKIEHQRWEFYCTLEGCREAGV